MDFRILGPVEVCVEGRPLALGGLRQRALLALLLMHAGDAVSQDTLVDELWAGRPTPTAVKTLHVQVSRLRRALGDAAAPLQRTANGYRFRLEADQLDLRRFERLSQEGRRALDAGDAEYALTALRAALDEWRGPPLADVAFEPFAQTEIARLEELRAAAVEDRIDAELALGRGGELIGELEALVQRHPLRERLRAQLMQALYRNGRQGEALEVYRDAARALDAELGLRPGPELDRLQQAILAHDPTLARAAPSGRSSDTLATAGSVVYVDAPAELAPRLHDVVASHQGGALAMSPGAVIAGFATPARALACAVALLQAADRQGDAQSVRAGVGGGVEAARQACEAAAPGRIRAADGREVPWEPARGVAVPLAGALATDAQMPFAGRDQELPALRAAWEAAVDGRRQAVLVSGEPGIGKTRLAAELARLAAQDGALVLYGQCDDGPAAPAQPFAEALGAYVAACPVDELRNQLGPFGGAALAVLPGLAARLPDLDMPASDDPDSARLRTLDAVAHLVRAAATDRPMLLVLDDLHWADELSLLLVRHVARADAAARLLVVASYRDTEPSRSPLLADIVAGLGRRQNVHHLELGPLAEPAIAAILAHSGRDESLAASVRETTDGNAFFVGEVVRALDDDVVTPRVRDVVRWRLSRLPDGAADVLMVAAATGRDFDVDIVAAAGGGGLTRTLDALEAAEAARLVRPGERSDRFTFAHDLVRETMLEDMPGARRTRIHAAIAEALERAQAIRAVDAGELAAHLLAAGSLADPATALRYAREAGDSAAARLAFDVAADHYEQALAAHARLPDAALEQRLDIELARGQALRIAGDERADRVLRSVAADAERVGDGERMGEALLATGLELATRFLEEDAEMLALLRRAVDLLPPGDGAVKARLLAYIASESLYSLSDARRESMIDDALAMARRVGVVAPLASVLTSASWTLMSPDRLDRRMALARELVVVGRSHDAYAECRGHVFAHLAAIELGDLATADAELAAAQAVAHVPVARWTVSQWTALRLLLAGRLDEAEAEAVRAAETAREAAMPAVVVDGSFAAVLWCIRAVQGRLPELESVSRAWMASLREPPVWVSVTEALLRCEQRDENGARVAFERAVGKGLLELPRGFAWTSTLTWAAAVCAWLEDRPRAERLYELLAPFAAVMSPESGPVALAAGRLAMTLGDRDGAEQHFRAAVALCERMDARAYLAVARRELGALLLPSAEGRGLVAQARTAAAELGLADATLATPSPRAGISPARGRPLGS